MTAPAPAPAVAPPALATEGAAALSPTIAALFAAVAPKRGPSGATVIAGGGVVSLGFYVIDRLLANDGQVAASMLLKLSPLLGPVWASWPIIALLVGIAAWAANRWRAAQVARSAADVAAALAAAELSSKLGVVATQVGTVATGLDMVRAEVHDLRGALQTHAETVDARLQAVRGEVSAVAARVDVLERPARKRPTRRA